MAKIICMWENASSPINGVEFFPHPEGMVSAEIEDQAVVDMFLSIPKYKLEPNENQLLTDLREQATSLGIKGPINKYGIERLQNEIRVFVAKQAADAQAEAEKAASDLAVAAMAAADAAAAGTSKTGGA